MTHPSIDTARQFVERKLVPWPEFEAALITGSLSVGEGRNDSDVDMILVFDPLDVRIVPGEFGWSPEKDEFYAVTGPAPAAASEIGPHIQIDAKRLSIDFLDSGDLSDGLMYELGHALPLFDRTGRVATVLERRLAYPLERRRAIAFRHRESAWIHQAKARARHRDRWISKVGIAGAVDVLVGGLEETILLVHACNGTFPPFRYRWLLSMEELDWIPGHFALFRDAVLAPSSADPGERLSMACEAFDRVLDEVDQRFRDLGWANHAGDVWVDSHRELGFGYNMNEWKQAHRQLVADRSTPFE